ncbi:MAG: peptide deformylase [Thermoleophilia bacterium]
MSNITEKEASARAEVERARREAQKEIRVVGDPVLRQRALPVEQFDRGLRKLIKHMVKTMHDAPGIGLAAPQIGLSQRLLVYDVDEGPQALVNPVLSEYSAEVEEVEEGCLSVPGLNMPVVRSVSVRVQAFDGYGAPLDFIAEELEARVIQHEFDHLEGTLILDRTTASARAEALREIAAQGPNLHAVGGGL